MHDIIKYCLISPTYVWHPEDGSIGDETYVGDIEQYLII